ncbi:hypothetical protein B0T24DRAFT_531695 [Lasiosphaeria ovina]|uniref:F-box domain-containing protein n=1 Tax=Lasiosphaeria ovina TaxID=92902 RepID=A0AAE0N6C6_9PEZI|nr:hypothetical protein B0T24DRAFT_531695 [Lasiosphaeria ovina]
MDPLVAAHMHNANYSPINRLPDELVFQILRCLGDDPLAVLCLRRVGRRFRRIIDGPDISKIIDVNYLSWSSGTTFEMVNCLPKGLRQELWHRIQKDGMCDECRMLRPGGPDDPDVGCLRSPRECPVMSRSPRGLHCDGCSGGGGDHNAHPCIGRHGAVRLCEHINISWADMEPYLSRWQQYLYDGQACLDGFSVECRDPSHDMRCRAEYPPTWPRASLKTTKAHKTSEWVVVLTFEWKPHSGSDVLSLTSDRRAPASEIRTMFQRYRQGAANILFPSYSQIPFPEMACFGDAKCQCLYYESGGDQRLSTADPSNRTLFWTGRWDPNSHSDAIHAYARCHGFYKTAEIVTIQRHLADIADESACLVTNYTRNITLCTRVGGGHVVAVTPANDWYHAVDPDLSPPQRSPNILCRDKSCINYYRSPASFACRVPRSTTAETPSNYIHCQPPKRDVKS